MQQTFTTATWFLTVVPLASIIILCLINYVVFLKRNPR